ncbi:MAG: hypothetical protein ACI4DU_08910 [Lachnospiraceae bacterium]
MLDKVDVRNRKLQMQGNLIKWWNVYETSDTDLFPVGNPMENQQGLEEDERELLALIMDENDHTNVYDKTLFELSVENDCRENAETVVCDDSDKEKLLDEANAIFNRLMQEAAEDRAEKEREIEEIKKLAQG